MVSQITIDNLEEMNRFAEKISKYLFPGFVLCLQGDLGAGKTTFTQFLGRYMGIEDTINSPTFTIMKNYNAKLPLNHMDVYRLNGIGADYDLEEYIYDEGVSVIEWYTHILESLPEEKLIINIEIIDNTKRRLIIEGNGRYEKVVKALSN